METTSPWLMVGYHAKLLGKLWCTARSSGVMQCFHGRICVSDVVCHVFKGIAGVTLL